MKKSSSNNQPATKEDIQRIEFSLKKFATKAELKKTERNLRGEILRVEERLERTEDKLLKKMSEQHDQVMTSISNFAGRVQTLETENEIGSDQIRRLDERLTTLEPTT